MPELRIPISPDNPGLFFACCGLFELAARQDSDSLAWFENGKVFTLQSEAVFPVQLGLLAGQSLEDKLYEAPLEELCLTANGKPIVLNWWLNPAQSDKSALKTWGGQQTPRRMLGELLAQVNAEISPPDYLEQTCYTSTRFGVDARTAWNTLDAGYSPNEIGQASVTYPWIELLAAIGLQGFRPAVKRRRVIYSLWRSPLTITPSRAIVASPWSGIPSTAYASEIADRGQGYKTLLIAKEFKNE